MAWQVYKFGLVLMDVARDIERLLGEDAFTEKEASHG